MADDFFYLYLQKISIQTCRSLAQLQKCCLNDKAFQNFILKGTSQNPPEEVVMMLQVLAVGMMFRLSLTFLKKNETKMFEQLNTNPNDVKVEDVAIHKKKIEKILTKWFPKPAENGDQGPKQVWGQLERWLGHDLIIKAIMRRSTPSNKKVMEYVKEGGTIPAILVEQYRRNRVKSAPVTPSRKGSRTSTPSRKALVDPGVARKIDNSASETAQGT